MDVAVEQTRPQNCPSHGLEVAVRPSMAVGWPWGGCGTPGAPHPPAGGQFKREVTVDGQSHLLLIREEAGAPDAKVGGVGGGRQPGGQRVGLSPDPLLVPPPQFANWADAVIFVFSLEDEGSFQEVAQLHEVLSGHRATGEVALALVGTQGEPGGVPPPSGDREGTDPSSPPSAPPPAPQIRSAPPTRG